MPKLSNAAKSAAEYFKDVKGIPAHRVISFIQIQAKYTMSELSKDDVGLKELETFDGVKNSSLSDIGLFEKFSLFADVAYEQGPAIRFTIEKPGFILTQWEDYAGLERPSYFVAYNPSSKECILSVRGTYGVDDVLTDILVDVHFFFTF